MKLGKKLTNLNIKENELFLIAGPCVIETRDNCYAIASELKEITARLGIPFIFKASYDKANRSSVSSFRGPGLDKGLEILNEIKTDLDVPVISDVHCRTELDQAKDVLDVIQIPAFLCRQTDFLVDACNTGRIINVKKGQFMAPWDMQNVVDKIESTGNDNLMLTERGYVFGYNNLVSDMRSIIIMRKMGYPVVFDVTHSVQLPGGAGNMSAGNAEFAEPLAMAACAVGCDGLFFETHDSPEQALCDGANMIPLDEMERVLKRAVEISDV